MPPPRIDPHSPCDSNSPPVKPLSPPADDANARAVRNRSYTTLTTPPDVRLHTSSGQAPPESAEIEGETDPAVIAEMVDAHDEESLSFNKLFHHCHNTMARPAERVFMRSLKAFTKEQAVVYHREHPDDFIALCSDMSDYEQCFYNYKYDRYCTQNEADNLDSVLETVFTTVGSFLDDPISDISSSTWNLFDMTKAYHVSMQGWRANNEDALCISGSLENNPEIAVACVLDGHGGDKVSEFVGLQFAGVIDKCLTGMKATPEVLESEKFKEALCESFLSMDNLVESEVKSEHSGSCGTTANLLVFTRTHYLTANAGDSRCVLSRSGKAIELSRDHKPDSPREGKRVVAAGGRVLDGRVEGLLAVSRAIGDFDFKQAGSLSQSEQAVSPAPDVTVTQRQPDDDFVIQACDGIWDCMTSEEVVDYVNKKLAEQMSPDDIIKKLCLDCLAPEITEDGIGTDNMSVVLIIPNK
eukprot:TRINITY_DN1772_c1_g1_i1.p1 TRINITY_DN1772_c1_g1~~TRINITY_DN1772_c1_g1_i1.p1  ORF type:complete len:469 (+),score=101.01 TRINITY_DN1772_c1_g1_i1:113-1519(+)